MNYRILLLSILAFGMFSCNNDDDAVDPCPTETILIETTSLETEYGCINTENSMEIDLPSGDFIIISDQQVFNMLVTEVCMPMIDFTTYDLVIGRQGLTSGNSSIRYDLIEICETGNQTLTVTFNLNATTVAPTLTFHALVPKLAAAQVLTVEIIIN
ncbi:hypothetical protein H2O64_06705 [Kordia sp. YSTF-M3]|uniref:Lipocalin-like domain-containing protein n=1 Tax=Kordia aestuariivivens TaxID=2759037 RepID=A0ABR7Q7Q9_9FLAO|nr:hypothetical protein [Kordia aestuariivivens]MBC8754354.1 hypothetical protein [Kordia aestuariivivens]